MNVGLVGEKYKYIKYKKCIRVLINNKTYLRFSPILCNPGKLVQNNLYT